MLAETAREGTDWVKDPIGYAMLLAAQTWFNGYVKSLYENKPGDAILTPKPKRRPTEKVLRARVYDVLQVFHGVPTLQGGISPALRSQFAGLLRLFARKLPDHLLKEIDPTLRPALRKLVTCPEPPAVRSRGQVFDDSSEPMSTASVALFGLIMLAWRERFGLETSANVLLTASQRDLHSETGQPHSLSQEDHQAIVAALEQPAKSDTCIMRVFGLCFPEILVLDLPVAKNILAVTSCGIPALATAFVDGVSTDRSAWILYSVLRPLYERAIRDSNAVVPHGVLRHVAFAYLLGSEQLSGDDSLFVQIRRACSPKARAGLIELVCDAYDELGRGADIWRRVRDLWQSASEEMNTDSVQELRGFWRCLQHGRKGITDSKDKTEVHVPESIETLATLLEKSCQVLASDPCYSTDERKVVTRYLAAQSVGHETMAVRLLAMCLGTDGKEFADTVVHYCEEAHEVLRNAVAAGGEAREIATKIIERHETESNESLAGLLL
jgi:hypothetical protein